MPAGSKRLVTELVDQALDRHAVLRRDARGRAQRVHPADGRAFLAHRDEQLARLPVVIEAHREIPLVPGHVEPVRHAAAGVGQAASVSARRGGMNALPVSHRRNRREGTIAVRARRGLGRRRVVGGFLGGAGLLPGFLLRLVGGGREGLAEFAPVAVERVGLQAQFPRQAVAPHNVFLGGVVGKVDGLRDRAADEGPRAAIILMCPSGAMNRLPSLPQVLARVKDRQVFGTQCGAPSMVPVPQMARLSLDLPGREPQVLE